MPSVPVRALLSTELRLHRRHGVIASAAVMAVVWGLVLVVLPRESRPAVVPWVLFFEVTSVGFFLAPALAVVERGNGVTAALKLTRLSPATALAVRLSLLAGSALAVGAVVVVAGAAGGSPIVLLGVVLTSVLFSLVAVVMVGRAETLTTFVARAPLVAAPLLAPALLHGTGLVASPVLHLSPATGALRLLMGHGSPLVLGWVTAWVVGLWLLAVRIGFDVRPGGAGHPGRVGRGPAIGVEPPGRWVATRSYLRVDGRTLLGDRVLLLLLGGIPVIALALRWFSAAGVDWVDARYGVDLTAQLPAVSAFVLVIHVPVIFGALVALLFLEDRDQGLLPALATTPAGLRTLVATRLVVTASIAAVAVAVMFPVAGVTHPAGAIGLAAAAVAGGGVATVPAVVIAAFARDRVQGVALMKVATVPLYLPVAWWFVDGPLGWLFAPIPTALAARTLWASATGPALVFAGACLAASLAVVRVLAPRLLRSPSVR